MQRPETLYSITPSPIGELLLVGDGIHLTGLYMPPHKGAAAIGADWKRNDSCFAEAAAQLRAYFAGERLDFDLPVAPRGTPFQQLVWSALTQIPYGETVTYGQLAARVHRPTAARAIGLATGRNPLSIVFPCHRVVGAGGALTGYGGGIERKRWLLELEAAVGAGRRYTSSSSAETAR